MPNKQLFIDVLARIEIEEASGDSHWNQRVWAEAQVPRAKLPDAVFDQVVDISNLGCGTSMCMAGWACVLSDVPLEWRVGHIEPTKVEVSAGYTKGGESVSIHAEDLLDIDTQDSDDLFFAGNSLGRLYELSAEILDIDEEELRADVKALITEIRHERTTTTEPATA